MAVLDVADKKSYYTVIHVTEQREERNTSDNTVFRKQLPINVVNIKKLIVRDHVIVFVFAPSDAEKRVFAKQIPCYGIQLGASRSNISARHCFVESFEDIVELRNILTCESKSQDYYQYDYYDLKESGRRFIGII